MSTQGHNLDQLIDRSETPKSSAKKRLSVWLLPFAILLGFALLFGVLFRDQLLPAVKVEVVPAIGIEEKVEGRPTAGRTARESGTLLFQASGWVEPDPLPIKATALTDGVIDEVKVLEGELVKKGQVLASLINIDSRLERDAMAAELADVKASFDAHCTGTQIAMQKMEIERASLAIAEANAEEAADKLRRYERLGADVIPENERVTVRYNHQRALAEIDAAKGRIAEIAEQMNQIAYEIVAIRARIEGAEVKLAQAELALSRTEVTSPIDGRVLLLNSVPGQKKMIGMDDEDSATVAILYDPQQLQVRVDVPLADAAGLGVGQRAKIRSNLLPNEVFDGVVSRITGSADLQRNTLQAKVRILNPNDKLRPEMLSRVEFFEFAPAENTAESSSSEAMDIAIYVPKLAVSDGSVWVCDPESLRAERRSVSTSATRENLIRVDEGLRPGEWVVIEKTEALEPGQRLNPVFNH